MIRETTVKRSVMSRAIPIPRLLLLMGFLLATTGVACRTTKPIARSPRTGELSVKPGINEKLKEGEVDKWIGRFEGESREIFHERERIADHVGVKSGMVMADIGAGTGFLTQLFAKRVQPGGRVYAVDIVPGFLELIRHRAKELGLNNIDTVLGKDDSVELPPDSIDLAFICDTYHHFEFPRSMMTTVHRALKPGGQLVILDFIRDEATSRAWILKHIRANRDRVIREIESDGFKLIDRGDNVSFLKENYIIRFRKAPQ